MKKQLILILGGIVALSSCKVGHMYVAMQNDAPELLEVNDSTSIADAPWREAFKDTTLLKLIDRTLVNNKDLKIAAARVQELAQSKRISQSKLFPNVGLNVYGQQEGLNYRGDGMRKDPEFGVKGTVSWELDLWGNLRWGREKAVAEYIASIEAGMALQMSIVAQVAESYFELVALDAELDVVRRTLSARKEGAELALLRYEGGITGETSYLQAKLEYARTATLIPELERSIAIKENEISFLAGEYPSNVERNKSLEDRLANELPPVGLMSDLLERRPDVRQAEQRLIAANASVGIAYTNMFPRIALTSDFGFETDQFASILKSPMYFISGKLLSPLFAFGRNRAQWKASEKAYEQECIRYEKTVMAAFYDAKNAIVNFNKEIEIFNARKAFMESSEATLDHAKLQYINGVIGYLDLLDVQRSYFDAQVSYARAVKNKQISMVQLYKALGGGWK